MKNLKIECTSSDFDVQLGDDGVEHQLESDQLIRAMSKDGQVYEGTADEFIWNIPHRTMTMYPELIPLKVVAYSVVTV